VIEKLAERWEAVWQELRAHTIPEKSFEDLVRAYSAPDHFYHTLAHIEDCLSIFDQTMFITVHPEEVELAIWFHDVVYNPKRDDNEQKSAEWAKAVINHAGLGSTPAKRISSYILATRHNQEITDVDAQCMVDVDLSILGREPEAFWKYEIDIRKEYAWVPSSTFGQRRIEILNGFLSRKSIYYHGIFRELFEQKARMNLVQAIEQLRSRLNA
jgi:predicted metal-dependent HD superfamily phosphohydrolase